MIRRLAPITCVRPRAALILTICLAVILFVSHLVVYAWLGPGDVASSTILAPRDFSIVNQAATAAARQRASAEVSQQFRSDPRPQQQATSLAATILRTAAQLRSSAKVVPSLRDAAGVLARASNGALSDSLSARLLKLSPQDLATVRTQVQLSLTSIQHQPVYSDAAPTAAGGPAAFYFAAGRCGTGHRGAGVFSVSARELFPGRRAHAAGTPGSRG